MFAAIDARAGSDFQDEAARFAAVERRDRRADGHFVYSVRTTGVYCRPSCPARPARRENVAFHATPAAAEQAGFRACKRCRPGMSAADPGLADRIGKLDWATIRQSLDERGYAVTDALLDTDICGELAALYALDSLFRSRVGMSRHGFGNGEYKYFASPLPPAIAMLRESLYRPLAEIANRWQRVLGGEAYPAGHREYLRHCHAAGQLKPTPLLLKYQIGDYNCLHQDLYGALAFPLQVAILLSRPGADFEGGEFVLVEQRPRMQSRVEVVPLNQGEAVIFAVNRRPVRGNRGTYRVTMRHGVSRLRRGQRFTLGVIFHDAA